MDVVDAKPADAVDARLVAARGYSEPSLFDLFAVMWRQRVIFAATAVAVMVLVVAAFSTVVPMYQAEARIALEHPRKPIEFDRSLLQYDPYIGTYEFELLNTQHDILLSKEVLSDALQAPALRNNPAYANPDTALKVLRARLVVDVKKDTWAFTTALTDEDPVRAEDGLRAVIAAFFAHYNNTEKATGDQTLGFLQRNLQDAKTELDKDRAAESAFRTEHGLLITDPEKSFIAQRLIALNGKRVVLSEQLSSLTVLVDQVRDAQTLAPTEKFYALVGIEYINRHPTVQQQLAVWYDLLNRESLLKQKYLEKHPRMIEIEEQLRAQHAELDRAIGFVCSSIQSDFQKLNLQKESLDERIAKDEAAMATYRADLIKLQELGEVSKAQYDLYESLLQRVGEQKVSAQADPNQLSLVSQPAADASPINKKMSLVAVLAVGGGIALGFLAALAGNFFDERMYTPGEGMRWTGLPVLAVLPENPRLPGLAMGAALDEGMVAPYANLRAALRLTRGRHAAGGEVLGIVSAVAGEGRSAVAYLLAVSLADAGQRVLLVDANLHRPYLHKLIDCESGRGMAALLAGEAGIAPAVSQLPNLDFMDAGVADGDSPYALVHSPCLAEWLTHCRTLYDVVIIDTPAVSLVPDTLVICQQADSVLVVVRDQVSRKPAVTAAMGQLAGLGSLRGVVYNGRPDPQARFARAAAPAAPAAKPPLAQPPVQAGLGEDALEPRAGRA
jgi:uncharacterized protein involved in exopolysaccharide biosynthesis/Mrp family chromosome partitioning ATPase